MSESSTFSVFQLGKYPATRALGQDGRGRLDDLLGEREDIDLTIDFAGVEVMNISFADEFLGKFLTSHDFSAKGTLVKIAGLNADNYYSVVVCIERRETQVVAVDQEDNLVLVGDKMLADTFEQTIQLGSFKANELAERMSLTAQNANNRLKRLAEAGAVRKAQVTGSTRGGRDYLYGVPSAAVSDCERLTLA